MPHAVEETTLAGDEALVLVSREAALGATFVPGAGMVCASLRHDDRELLHVGEGLPAYRRDAHTFGVPLLHPWANRLERLGYAAAGLHVRLDPQRMPVRLDEHGLAIHGLLHASERWAVTRTEADAGGALLAARYDAAGDPPVFAGFPFAHTLELVVRLRHDLLSWSLTLTATGDLPVPVAFGWHPYLTLPGVPREQWEIELPVVRQALLDGNGIPTGQTRPPEFRSGVLGERAFDDLYPLLSDPAEFVLRGGEGALRVRFEEHFPCAQVYAPAGSAFICFEPMTAPTDALRRDGPSLPLVLPGDALTARWSLLVEGRPGR